MELRHTAAREGRLSSFLRGELKMSSGLMNKLKWGEGIRVNGIPQRTNYPVKPGDTITVELAEEAPEYPAEDGPLSVCYEDDFLLVVDKPAGMLIHPSRARNEGTLANLVAGYYRRTGQKGAFHPVTRLDRDTFGIVLLAKNAYAHALLQEAQVRKTYHALTFGGPQEDAGVIDAPIARRPLPSLLRYVGPEGKRSITEFQVLRRQETLCKLALRPVTGRTHQLRVHCAYMGYPILGDPQYGSIESQTLSAELGLTHQQLCAKRLAFSHPVTGETLVLESKMDVRL
ncbi:MAG: RluA family pseudouridine synthase [Faecousia sp.]